MFDVACHNLHHVVVRAAHGVALDDVRLGVHLRMEGLRGVVGLFLHGDLHEGGHGEPELVLVDIGRVATDRSGRLELLDPAKGWRFGQADALGEVGVGDASTGLQHLKNSAFRFVEHIRRIYPI